jgi:hypothetical protein
MVPPPDSQTGRPASVRDDEHLQNPSPKQFLTNRGKSPTPPLRDRVIVYDADEISLEVRSRKEIEQSKHNFPFLLLLLTGTFCLEEDDFIAIPIQRRSSDITLMFDPKNRSDVKTDTQTGKGEKTNRNYVELATINLHRLSLVNRWLMLAGTITTLYVTKPEIWTPMSD